MKATWRAHIVDFAQLKSDEIEEVDDSGEFVDLFHVDEELRKWDEEDRVGFPQI